VFHLRSASYVKVKLTTLPIVHALHVGVILFRILQTSLQALDISFKLLSAGLREYGLTPEI
jgi:hypothetical protein